MLQNLRIGPRKKRNGKSKVPARSSVEAGRNLPEIKRRKIKQHSSHLRKIGACLRHQILNLRNENLLSTPERRCTWSAKKDSNSAEMDTLTTSRSPTTLKAANGEVQTREEATVLCQRIGYILDNESPGGYVSSFIARKALRRTRILLWMDQWSINHISFKNGIRIQCNTENFVPIVVPGLSTSSSSSFPSSTSMTPSRQEIDHPTSSSSSSSSSTMTSSTVSSDTGTRAREDLCGKDSYPVTVSSEHVERKERGDLLTKQTKNPKPNKNEDDDFERDTW